MDTNNQIDHLLTTLGLDDREVEIYRCLYRSPWQTVTQLAAALDIPRPTLYRTLEEMTKRGIVQSKLDYKTTYFATTPTDAFHNSIAEQQRNLVSMQKALEKLGPLLSATPTNTQDTQVSFFRGIHGLRSMEWQNIRDCSNSEELIFGNHTWWKYLTQEFAEQMRQERVNRNIRVREILNPQHRSNGDETWTKVPHYLEHFSDRYIDTAILPIENELIISPKSVYLYSLNDTEQVGIKITSSAYSAMLKAFFEMAWKIAKE